MKTKMINIFSRLRAAVENRAAPLSDSEGYPTYTSGFLAASDLTLITAGVASIFNTSVGLFFAMVSSVTQ